MKRETVILLVDDDPATYRLLKSVLNDSYNIEFVESGEDAWEFFFGGGGRCKFFDLIILDIVMPKMDGIDLLKRIREINPWIPVLIITGYGTYSRAKEACNLKVSGFIEKPFNEGELLKKIEGITKTTYNGYIKSVSQGASLTKKEMYSLHPVTKRCLEKIHNNFHNPITINHLANYCALSKSHLGRIFKKDCGITIKNYINNLRIEVAKRLLNESSYTVSLIQEILGFKSRTYFFNLFKKKTGMSPLKFRKMGK